MLMAIDEEMMGLVTVGTGRRVTPGLQNTLDHISDRLRLSAENRKGFGCPKLQSSHRGNRGRRRMHERMDEKRKQSEEADRALSRAGSVTLSHHTTLISV